MVARSASNAAAIAGHRCGPRSRHGIAVRSGRATPSTTTWLRVSASGLSSTGFIRTSGSTPGGAGLQPLGDADLAAVDDTGVVGHVLGLERHDVDAAAGEPAAQRGDEQATCRRSTCTRAPSAGASPRHPFERGDEAGPARRRRGPRRERRRACRSSRSPARRSLRGEHARAGRAGARAPSSCRCRSPPDHTPVSAVTSRARSVATAAVHAAGSESGVSASTTARASPLTDQRGCRARRRGRGIGIWRDRVADPQPGAGPHLRERADPPRAGVAPGPGAGGERVERLVPDPRPRRRAGRGGRGVRRVRSPPRRIGRDPFEVTAVQRELRLDDRAVAARSRRRGRSPRRRRS